MKVTVSQKKAGTGTKEINIGYWCGPLICVNPDLAKKKELYGWPDKEDEKEIAYTGEKDGKDWSRLVFVFQDSTTGKYIEYGIFISDELAEFESSDLDTDGNKIKKQWWINQHGNTQLVDKEENLFKSFTHMQKQNEEKTAWEDVLDENGEPVKLIYRQAYKGETALYSLLKKLVTQNWFEADAETSLFIKLKELLRGQVKDITTYIGTDTFQPVVGMMYVEAKDTENGIQYNNNCIDGAWLPGWKIKDVNINSNLEACKQIQQRIYNKQTGWQVKLDTATKEKPVTDQEKREHEVEMKDMYGELSHAQTVLWQKFDVAPKGKGSYKLKDMYQFYQSCKRCKHIYEFSPLHTFDPSAHQAAGNQTFIAATESEKPSNISY